MSRLLNETSNIYFCSLSEVECDDYVWRGPMSRFKQASQHSYDFWGEQGRREIIMSSGKFGIEWVWGQPRQIKKTLSQQNVKGQKKFFPMFFSVPKLGSLCSSCLVGSVIYLQCLKANVVSRKKNTKVFYLCKTQGFRTCLL